jgi:hypothetical protein
MECIEVEEGLIVTPKMFVKMGEKEKLKDWKTAVRVNGIPIRYDGAQNSGCQDSGVITPVPVNSRKK